jgi:hypothetical protein
MNNAWIKWLKWLTTDSIAIQKNVFTLMKHARSTLYKIRKCSNNKYTSWNRMKSICQKGWKSKLYVFYENFLKYLNSNLKLRYIFLNAPTLQPFLKRKWIGLARVLFKLWLKNQIALIGDGIRCEMGSFTE